MKLRIFIFFILIASCFILTKSYASTNSADSQVALLQVSENNGIADALGKLIGFITGSIGKALMSIIIVVVGIAALLGKVSLGLLIGVVVGSAIIFGSSSILVTLSPGDKAKNGAKCQTEKVVGYNYDSNGNKIAIMQKTGLTSDCKKL